MCAVGDGVARLLGVGRTPESSPLGSQLSEEKTETCSGDSLLELNLILSAHVHVAHGLSGPQATDSTGQDTELGERVPWSAPARLCSWARAAAVRRRAGAPG